jgi:EmrB/QacA subfamily drug resistance transporter
MLLPHRPTPLAGGRLGAVTLVASCVASYLVVSDVAMVNVALPSISDGLRLTASDVHWLITCYALAFSALPLLAGRIADRFGHVRVFTIGVGVFSVAAGVCGCAETPSVLEVARAVQGVGGAVVAATTLSLLTSTFIDATGRRRALAVWSATVSGGAAAGVLIGGVLTAELGWRWVFLISAIIGGLCLFGTSTQLAGSRATVLRARHLDLPGGLLVSVGLGCTVLGLSQAQLRGWESSSSLALLAGGVLVLGVFLVVELRSPDPLLPPEMLRAPGRVGAYAVTAIVGANLYFLYFAVSVYLQRVAGSGPLMAGVESLPAALAVVAGALASTWTARRFTARHQLVGSMIAIAAGFFWLSRISDGDRYWTHVGLPLTVIGLGFGLSFVPATALGTAGVRDDRAGVASGLVNSSRQLGRAIGLATLSGLVISSTHPSSPAAIVSGESRAFTICGLAALAGVVVVWLLIPRAAAAEVLDEPRDSYEPRVDRDPVLT